jgi:hypothetical protein
MNAKIAIIVSGGCVQAVYQRKDTSETVEVDVFDCDGDSRAENEPEAEKCASDGNWALVWG